MFFGHFAILFAIFTKFMPFFSLPLCRVLQSRRKPREVFHLDTDLADPQCLFLPPVGKQLRENETLIRCFFYL